MYFKKWWCKIERNAMFITFSQQILYGRLLLVVTSGKKKSNLNCEFKLKPITTYYLKFVAKVLWKFYECNYSQNK